MLKAEEIDRRSPYYLQNCCLQTRASERGTRYVIYYRRDTARTCRMTYLHLTPGKQFQRVCVYELLLGTWGRKTLYQSGLPHTLRLILRLVLIESLRVTCPPFLVLDSRLTKSIVKKLLARVITLLPA